ncbi:MAG: class I SAM-dependent methyltransferase [Alphaproteobacteria bacterium]|nr:class I SAM-dependent methyltransferase [Alphaproteobacteria bacterium]
MQEICELCGSDALESVYTPERSTRGITVHICGRCGLVQSLPRADRAPRAAPAVSSGADWGNVRYGKGFRTKIAVDAVLRHSDPKTPFSLLDVGSNRGSFARALLSAAPQAHITAIEPDERVAQSCAGLERSELQVARIEDAALETGRFDIIHSCHTIEHLAHPAHVLGDHRRVLKNGGRLVLDAPNIAILGADDIVEEWFIDKHLYHFSERTLSRMVEAAGFAIVEKPDRNDAANLFLVARKADAVDGVVDADPREVERAYDLMSSYVATRAHNMAALVAVAAELQALAPKGVAMWGAGRIFDSLVVHGRFDAKALRLLIDTHLKAHVGERHGCALAGPEDLIQAKPDVIVVMSRGFADEIAAEARKFAPAAEILLYTDLLSRARTRLAA